MTHLLNLINANVQKKIIILRLNVTLGSNKTI